MKTAKNGGTKSAQIKRILKGLNSKCECRRDEAGEEYSRIIHRGLYEGRVLRVDLAKKLLPIALELATELDVIEAENHFWDAKFELKAARNEIRKAVKNRVSK